MKHYALAVLLLTLGCFSEGDDVDLSSSSSTESTSSSSTTSSTSSSSVDDSSSSETSTSSEGGSAVDTTETSGSSSESSTTEHVTLDYALYFGGTSSAASADAVDLDLAGDFTVELWARVDAADATGTVVCHRGGGTTGWKLSWSRIDSTLLFGVYDNNGDLHVVHGSDAGELDAGWHHVAAVKQGTALRLYIDGALDATASTLAGISAPVVPLVVGDGEDEGALFGIAVDDLRISTGARYTSAFEPEVELSADADARVLLLFDEGDAEASIDAASDLSFLITEPVWTPGNTESPT